MKKPQNFIIIDDDENNNMLCEMIIKCALGRETKVKTFSLASNGIDYIKNESIYPAITSPMILFLDINMPQLSGWEALEMLNALDENIKKQFMVFMVSSSIDPKDKRRAMDHPLVHRFLEKPLTIDNVKELFDE
jgi:CheY-like chemotaxis protein